MSNQLNITLLMIQDLSLEDKRVLFDELDKELNKKKVEPMTEDERLMAYYESEIIRLGILKAPKKIN